MALCRMSRHSYQQLAQLQSAAARGLQTSATVQATTDPPGSRDRETADEETFKRPFYCIKTNKQPPWPRTTGRKLHVPNTGVACNLALLLAETLLCSAVEYMGVNEMYVVECRHCRHDGGAGAIRRHHGQAAPVGVPSASFWSSSPVLRCRSMICMTLRLHVHRYGFVPPLTLI